MGQGAESVPKLFRNQTQPQPSQPKSGRNSRDLRPLAIFQVSETGGRAPGYHNLWHLSFATFQLLIDLELWAQPLQLEGENHWETSAPKKPPLQKKRSQVWKLWIDFFFELDLLYIIIDLFQKQTSESFKHSMTQPHLQQQFRYLYLFLVYWNMFWGCQGILVSRFLFHPSKTFSKSQIFHVGSTG